MALFVNEAAWLPTANARPVKVEHGPTPNPCENEVVIKVAYASVNPADWKLQDGPSHLTYPFIYGLEVAGKIVQLGSQVTQLKLGQRVIGHCDGLLTQKTTNMGFQHYSTCVEHLVSPVPDSLPLLNASVLPVGIDTAAAALYGHLKLPLPSLNPAPLSKKILIWGGSSSCGSSAIQLAVASGLEVVTTASSSNHELVRSLGATHVLNYKNPDVVDQLLSLLKPGDYVVDCIATKETQTTCGEILGRIGGGKLPVVNSPQGTYPENVEPSMVVCLPVAPELGHHIWHKFIPEALAAGKYQAKPDPHLIPGGLERVQEAIDLLRQGVSAKKIVIEIAAE
ncbi:alcohol dehydrogenase [Penicillium malachiteum]|uniref:alcohol dehydrogenase n=1 Tax=Penicillium malachiteum TaxID=1324776 RepID=UPI0025477CE3|nr:alcohol dehydrogenase [Penicillium malachiteum]KAJ5713359.1 alcohol dehydrogenase [Penicillium malachiteum]